MKASTQSRLGIAIMVFILMGASILSPGTVYARGPMDLAANGKEAPSRLPHDKVTIEKKNLETVTTKFGDVYALFDETIIVGADGAQIDIRKLPVPCIAEISYAREKGARKALRIGVVSVHANATTNWTAKTPQ